jgi:hypothetical protein
MFNLHPIPRGVAVTTAAAVLSLGGAASAHAGTSSVNIIKPRATSNARVVSFSAPASQALVTSKSVPVRLKVGSQVTGVKVYAGHRNISARFTRHGRGYTARLPRSLFKTGTNRLLVQAKARGGKGGGAAATSIVIPRQTAGLMIVGRGAKAAAARFNPAAGNLPATSGQIPVAVRTKSATYARLTVNGHRVSNMRANRPLPSHYWLVSVRDGLKVGRNRFMVQSWDKKGHYAVKRWTVKRSGSRPFAEAGPQERVVRPTRWTTLNGSGSRATKKGAKLKYVWRVVKAPNGAKWQLRRATAAKPQFKPGKPGVYKLALRATQVRPGMASAAAASSASQDVITLDAVPTLGAQGLYVYTGLFGNPNKNTPPYNTLYVEGQPFAYGTDTSSGASSTTDTFVQLDETTMAIVASGTHSQITPKAGTITIGVWFNTTVPYSSDQDGSAIWIGTTQVALNSTSNNPGTDVGDPTSFLQGWIQPATASGTDDATYVDSDMVQLKTRLPSDTPTSNTMEINGQPYDSAPLSAGATGGWQLVMLDNDGKPWWNQTFSLTGNPTTDAATEDQLAYTIQNNRSWGYTWILQAFGNVPAVPASSKLAAAIQSLGGRADVVDRFNGTADSTGGVYALVSGGSIGAANSWSPNFKGTESSFERTGTSGSLTALLVRDATQDDYVPFSSDSAAPAPAGANPYSFLPMAYAAPSDWSRWVRNSDGTLGTATTAQNAALSDLVSQVVSHGWVPTTKLCPNAPDAIRGYYCTTNAANLQTLLSRISNQLSFSATTANGRYTQSDWNTAQYSIEDEIGDVSNMRAAIADYQGLFGTASIDGAVDAPTIADSIRAAINKSTNVSTNAHLDNILGALTDMASVIPAIGPEMTFISGAFSLDSATEPDWSPQPALDSVSVTQDTAAATLVSALQQASGRLSDYVDYLVSDPVKLSQGAQYLMNNDPQTSDSNSAIVRAAGYATQQWLWGTLLAPVYTAWQVPTTIGTDPFCADTSSVGHPWNNLSATGSWQSSGTSFTVNPSNWLLGFDKQNGSYGWAVDNGDDLNNIGLPGSITDKLFGQPVSTTSPASPAVNSGAIMPYFALDYLPVKNVPVAPEAQWKASPAPKGCQPY